MASLNTEILPCKANTKKSKPNLHITIPERNNTLLAASVYIDKSKTPIPYPDQICRWKGCTSQFSRHVHLYPEDLRSYGCIEEWLAEEIHPSCPFQNCDATEAHRHLYSYNAQELLHEYQSLLKNEYSHRVTDMSEEYQRKSEDQIVAEVQAAKAYENSKWAWNPYDDPDPFDRELARILMEEDDAAWRTQEAERLMKERASKPKVWRSTFSTRQKMKVSERSSSMRLRGGGDAETSPDPSSTQTVGVRRKDSLIRRVSGFVQRRQVQSLNDAEGRKSTQEQTQAHPLKNFELESSGNTHADREQAMGTSHHFKINIPAPAGLLPEDPRKAAGVAEDKLAYIDGMLAMFRYQMMVEQGEL